MILGRRFIRDERRFRRETTAVFRCPKDVCDIESLPRIASSVGVNNRNM